MRLKIFCTSFHRRFLKETRSLCRRSLLVVLLASSFAFIGNTNALYATEKTATEWIKEAENYHYLRKYKEAYDAYFKAANMGSDKAQYMVGYYYTMGVGVDQDYTKAAEWYGKASEQGNAQAQFELGEHYEFAYGVKQDYQKAFLLYRRAATQKNSSAMSAIARMYEKGHGVDMDKTKAEEWYLKSIGYGNAYALEAMNRLYEAGYEGKGIEIMPVTDTFQFGEFIQSMAFSPDNKYLAVASYAVPSDTEKEGVVIWDLEKREVIKKLDGHGGSVVSAGFSPDGKYLILVKSNVFFVWRVENWSLVYNKSYLGGFTCFDISTDSKFIATGSMDDTIKLWSLKTGELHRTLTPNKGPIRDVWQIRFSPSGNFLAAKGVDPKSEKYKDFIMTWDLKTGNAEDVFSDSHGKHLSIPTYSSTGRYLAAMQSDLQSNPTKYEIKVWDNDNFDKLVAHFQNPNRHVSDMRFHPLGNFLIMASHDIIVRNIYTNKEIQRVAPTGDRGYDNLALSADGKFLAAEYYPGTVEIRPVKFFDENAIFEDVQSATEKQNSSAIEFQNESAQDLYEKAYALYTIKNYDAAVPLFRAAADKGYIKGQAFLGWLYQNGNGVEKDYTQAAKWYLLAAEGGEKTAQNNLGVLYEEGLGLTQNFNLAEQWYKKSADQNFESAKRNLASLKKRMQELE